MHPPLALVTGWPGWLTSHLFRCIEHSDADWVAPLRRFRWRALVAPGVRPPSCAKVCEVIHGDVRDPETCRAATRGAQLVLHAAGIIHPRRIRDLYAVNGEGCRLLVTAARDQGCERFLLVSSNAAAGFAQADRPMTESDPAEPASHYGRSKLQGEQALWSAIDGCAMTGVVLRPTTFYGPWFPRRQLRAFAMARSGRVLLLGSGNNMVSMIFIDDLVDLLGRALTMPEAERGTFFAADATAYRWRDVFAAMGTAQGRRVRFLCLPSAVSHICHGIDRVLSATGRYAMLPHVAGEATRHMNVDIGQARRRLGFSPSVGLIEGMQRAVAWAREEGWL